MEKGDPMARLAVHLSVLFLERRAPHPTDHDHTSYACHSVWCPVLYFLSARAASRSRLVFSLSSTPPPAGRMRYSLGSFSSLSVRGDHRGGWIVV